MLSIKFEGKCTHFSAILKLELALSFINKLFLQTGPLFAYQNTRKLLDSVIMLNLSVKL